MHNIMDRSSWVVCCLILGGVLRLSVNAQTNAYSRVDITGNDIDCGQGSKKCRICGDINSIESSCRANPACVAFSFDNSCGYLKTAGEPRGYREGYTVFLLVGKSATPAATPAASPAAGVPAAASPLPAAASPAPAASPLPAAASPLPAAASPSPSPSPSPAAAVQPVPTTPTSQPPAVSPLASPAPVSAAAGGGGCSLNAWDQCGGAGNDCTGPGRSCVDGPFPGCTCPAGYPCQKKDSFFYQCAPPGHFGAATTTITTTEVAANPPTTETAPVPAEQLPVTYTRTATATAQSTPGGGQGTTTQQYFTGQQQGGGGIPGFGFASASAGPGGWFSNGGRKLLNH